MSNVLIVIDVQKAFHDKSWGERNNLGAENNIDKLLNYYRDKNKEIIHIKHISDDRKSLFHENNLQEFLYETKSNEKVIKKYVNSAFIGTDLHETLQEKGLNHITVVGISLPHCVSTTVRMAKNLGYKVDLIEDATFSFDLKNLEGNILKAKDVHTYNIAALNHEFAEVYSTAEYLSE